MEKLSEKEIIKRFELIVERAIKEIEQGADATQFGIEISSTALEMIHGNSEYYHLISLESQSSIDRIIECATKQGEEEWDYLQDDMVKYECNDCRREFTVGNKSAEGQNLTCPYCQSCAVEWVTEMSVELMEEEGLDLGCSQIFFPCKKEKKDE